jgi:hypothetical protein
MASQVLSGTSNPTYTNNTGGNVRVVINYMLSPGGMTWAGVSIGGPTSNILAIGRNLAFSGGFSASGGGGSSAGSFSVTSESVALSSNNMVMRDQPVPLSYLELTNQALPTEIMLAPGQVFTATCGAYNIVVIPEAG